MDEILDATHDVHKKAQQAHHRAPIVIHGAPQNTRRIADAILDATLQPHETPLLIADEDRLDAPTHHIGSTHTREILGTTHPIIVLDAHDQLDPNALGASTGALAGGGLYLLLTPPLDTWPGTRDAFDPQHVTEPYTLADVTGRFKHRLARTLHQHDATTLLDADTPTIQKHGTLPPHEPPKQPDWAPHEARFPPQAYDACLTRDQKRALNTLEHLLDDEAAIVLESDRGRGKTSTLGLAAASLAHQGRTVHATAPHPDNLAPLLDRAHDLLTTLDHEPHQNEHTLTTQQATIQYHAPADLPDLLNDDPPDALLVDEAASLPTHLLTTLHQANLPTAYATTVHGYEGAGRGFTHRFKPRLNQSPRPTHEITLHTPIRYADNDPLERLTFHALLLDAAPPPQDAIHDASPHTTTYHPLPPETLHNDETLLRQAFGLLVQAHYQTTPRDVARLLDAPNLHAHALLHDGHVVTVALLAQEGNLPKPRCTQIHQGDEINNHLIPDVLTTQLRDEHAAHPTGHRIVRIATHPAVQRRGLATHLLDTLHDQLDPDWFGTAYGATPHLIRFWRENGYRTVHIGTGRNASSGEHSILMMRPATPQGRDLVERNTDWFTRRIPSVLADALRTLDPDVAREALHATHGTVPVTLTERERDHLTACMDGLGVYDANPEPFRKLGLQHLTEQRVSLNEEQERLIVAKVLQARSWADVAKELGFASIRQAKLGLMEAYRELARAA